MSATATTSMRPASPRCDRVEQMAADRAGADDCESHVRPRVFASNGRDASIGDCAAMHDVRPRWMTNFARRRRVLDHVLAYTLVRPAGRRGPPSFPSRCSVSKIRELKDASVLDAPKPRPRELSPAALARQKEYARLRDLMDKLNDPNQVYEIVLEPNEKPLTVRQRLLKVAHGIGQGDRRAQVRQRVRGRADDARAPLSPRPQAEERVLTDSRRPATGGITDSPPHTWTRGRSNSATTRPPATA